MRHRQVQGVRLTPEEHSEIFSRVAAGDTQRVIARDIGCSERTIRRLLWRPKRTRRAPKRQASTNTRMDETLGGLRRRCIDADHG